MKNDLKKLMEDYDNQTENCQTSDEGKAYCCDGDDCCKACACLTICSCCDSCCKS